MSEKPNRVNKVLTGRGAEEIDISPQYQRTMITITGNQEGVITLRAKQQHNIHFEDVMNGELNLKYNKTLTIDCIQLQSLEFTIIPSRAYNVEIKQYDPEE